MNSVSHGGSMDTVLFSLLVDIVNHDDVRVVHKFCNKPKCEYLPMNRRHIDKIYMECI